MSKGYIGFESCASDEQIDELKEYFRSFKCNFEDASFVANDTRHNLALLVHNCDEWMNAVAEDEFFAVGNAVMGLITKMLSQSDQELDHDCETLQAFVRKILSDPNFGFKMLSRLNLLRLWFYANRDCNFSAIFFRHFLLMLETCHYPSDFLPSLDDLESVLSPVNRMVPEFQLEVLNGILRLLQSMQRQRSDISKLKQNRVIPAVLQQLCSCISDTTAVDALSPMAHFLFSSCRLLNPDLRALLDAREKFHQHVRLLFQAADLVSKNQPFDDLLTQNCGFFEALGLTTPLMEEERRQIVVCLTTLARDEVTYSELMEAVNLESSFELEMLLFRANESGVVKCSLDSPKRMVHFRRGGVAQETPKTCFNLRTLLTATKDVNNLIN